MRDIAQITNVDKSTLSRIGKCLCSNDDVALEKMLCPSTYKRGSSTVLTSEEEAMLTERLIYAEKRGFAVGKDTLKSFMSQIASGGRPSWKDRVPSEDAIRAFRARHREITFKNAEKKDRSKFRGESFDHVERFLKMLKDVEKSNPGILSDGGRVWNMDETSISCKIGKRTKGFCSSQTHHGGFVASSLDSIGCHSRH